MPDFPARYNIAPGSSILAVRATPDGYAGALMRWGFIPAWAKDAATLPMLNNARGETVGEKPMFRPAFQRRRCLIPASGYYEWKAVPGQKTKQPFYICGRDGAPLSFAGLWESARTADGERIETCAIITTTANAVLEPIHHRMPVVIDRAQWPLWLGTEPAADASLRQLLVPAAADMLQAWGVGHAVNKVSNDHAALLLPIAQTA